MAPRTEDQEQQIAQPERHVGAKGSHRRQRSTSAAKESVLSALIQKRCRSRPEEKRSNWVSREPTSNGVLLSRPDRFERTSLSDFESRVPPPTASTTGGASDISL